VSNPQNRLKKLFRKTSVTFLNDKFDHMSKRSSNGYFPINELLVRLKEALLVRSFLASFLALVPCFVCHAANPGTPLTNRQFAEQLIFYKEVMEFRVNFHQVKALKEMDLELKSEGSLHFNRPEEFEWEIFKPARLLFKLHGDIFTMESGSGEHKSVERMKIGDMPSDGGAKGLSALIAWMKLDVDALEAKYKIIAIQPRSFHLQPREETSMLKGMDVKINPLGYIERLGIQEVSGDSLDIHFDKPRVLRRAGTNK
jgi:hypothetical protein